MFTWFINLFHKHNYVVVLRDVMEYKGKFVGYLFVSVCSTCGKIKKDKIKWF